VPITSIGALAAAIMRHLAGPNPELATIFTPPNPASSNFWRISQIAAADTPQLLLGAVAVDRVRRVHFERRVGAGGISACGIVPKPFACAKSIPQ
jgi:hypothetical protein